MTYKPATGADISLSEVTFSCPEGHDVPQDVSRADVLAEWNAYRTQRRHAS